jgi:hypothetical protein
MVRQKSQSIVSQHLPSFDERMAFEKMLGSISANSAVIRHESLKSDVFPVVVSNDFLRPVEVMKEIQI